MKTLRFIALIVFTSLLGCKERSTKQEPENAAIESHTEFLKAFDALCNKKISAHLNCLEDENPSMGTTEGFFKCSENEVRITFERPDTISTTIVLTLLGENLLLKHDVRLADGSPAEQTMYGGFAETPVTPLLRRFPSHKFDAELWHEKEAYFWEVFFDHKHQMLNYIEYKAGEPVFCITFFNPDL